MKHIIKIHIITILIALLSLQLHSQETLTKDSDRFIFNTKTGEVLIVESAAMTFDAKTPVVEVLVPNGGESAGHATPLEVGWSAADETLTEAPVSVFLLTETGTVSFTLAAMIANTGNESFNLPVEAVGQSKISITATDAFGNVGEDMSNDFFTITCQPPQELTVQQLTETTAIVVWSATGTGVTYDLLYGFSGFDPLTQGTLVQGISENSYSLNDLMPSTAYQCYVRTVCGETPGEWSVPAEFTTPSGEEHTVCIPQGWSIISSYNQPYNPTMPDVFAPLTANNQVVIVLGMQGIYWPSQNVNTLGNWDVYQGYKIKMNSAGCLQIAGEPPLENAIALPQGASYLPVLCEQPVPVSQVLEPLGNDLLIAFDLYSQLIYWPIGQIFTLEYLEPGKGYLLNMIVPGEITYTCAKSSLAGYTKAHPLDQDNAPWNVSKTGVNHFIAIAESALSQLQTDDYIGVFDPEGNCAGFTKVEQGKGNLLLVVNGADLTTEDGLSEGEAMEFRVYNAATKETITVEVTFNNGFPHSSFFAESGQSMITGLKSLTDIAESRLNSIRLNPNPNDGRFHLELPSYDHPITIELLSANGVLILSEDCPASDKPTSLLFDLSEVKPGLYFVKITGDDGIILRKLIVR